MNNLDSLIKSGNDNWWFNDWILNQVQDDRARAQNDGKLARFNPPIGKFGRRAPPTTGISVELFDLSVDDFMDLY